MRLAYDVAGPPGDAGVLLIMGLQARGRAWRGQVERLVDEGRWPVVWFDNRGVGESRAPSGRWTAQDLARDAWALAEHLGWRAVHVVGVSMGGMIGQELALLPGARDRLRSLCLVATHAGGPVARVPTADGLRRFAKIMLQPMRRDRPKVRERVSLFFPLDWWDARSPDERRTLLEDLRKSFTGPSGEAPGAAARFSQLSVVLTHDSRRRLHRLEGLPTLVVCAGRDLLVRPAACRRLAQLIPGASLLDLRHAGHGVLRQCRDEVNEALVRHLRSADAACADAPGRVSSPA